MKLLLKKNLLQRLATKNNFHYKKARKKFPALFIFWFTDKRKEKVGSESVAPPPDHSVRALDSQFLDFYPNLWHTIVKKQRKEVHYGDI